MALASSGLPCAGSVAGGGATRPSEVTQPKAAAPTAPIPMKRLRVSCSWSRSDRSEFFMPLDVCPRSDFLRVRENQRGEEGCPGRVSTDLERNRRREHERIEWVIGVRIAPIRARRQAAVQRQNGLDSRDARRCIGPSSNRQQQGASMKSESAEPGGIAAISRWSRSTATTPPFQTGPLS